MHVVQAPGEKFPLAFKMGNFMSAPQSWHISWTAHTRSLTPNSLRRCAAAMVWLLGCINAPVRLPCVLTTGLNAASASPAVGRIASAAGNADRLDMLLQLSPLLPAAGAKRL